MPTHMDKHGGRVECSGPLSFHSLLDAPVDHSVVRKRSDSRAEKLLLNSLGGPGPGLHESGGLGLKSPFHQKIYF